MARQRRRPGFTLIELLVVIAIIALLIGILLPALARARRSAWQAVSLSNMRQVNQGCTAYRADNDNFIPFMPNNRDRGFPDNNGGAGWCTWSYGGKNNNSWWASGNNRIFDIEAADRPLNPYVVPDTEFYAPPVPETLPPDHEARTMQEAFVYRDPSDKTTHQRSWPRPTEGISSYDDVGTSYHINVKWWYQIPDLPWQERISLGTRRIRAAESFAPSRFVWIHDEMPDIVVNNVNLKVVNGYGDINKGVLGFLDGHGAYMSLHSPEYSDDPLAYSNENYTFIFDDLRNPNDG